MSTYLLEFNGNGVGYEPFVITRIYDTHSQEKIFRKLFEKKDGWEDLQDIFEDEFDDLYYNKVLGCDFPKNPGDTFDYLAAFVKYYIKQGWKQFFIDVDKTWVERDTSAYAFVKDDELDKFLTIIKRCSYTKDVLADLNTSHLSHGKYYKNKRKRSNRR